MHHVPKDTGWIEVVVGSMFSGKTEELIRRLRRAQYAKQKVQVFKPALDDRYVAGSIASHDQRTLEARLIDSPSDIYLYLELGTEVIGIDEAQFLGKGLVEVVQDLANRGLRVVVAALDQDYRGVPFPEIPELMATSEYVTKNLAICVQCGNPANRSQRLHGGDSKVQVGAAESYEPRCRACFRPEVIGQQQFDMGDD